MSVHHKKIMLTAALFAFALAGSTSYAKPPKPTGPLKWLEPSVDRLESVVITVKTDPLEDPEPACIAIQIGINLLLSEVPGQPGETVLVTPADRVVLFPTLDGLELVNPLTDLKQKDCDTPSGLNTGSLQGLLNRFIQLGGEVQSCPLCANRRDITKPTFGTIATGEDIHDLFLYADKVIPF